MNAGKLNRKHIMKENSPPPMYDEYLLRERKEKKLIKSCSPLGKSNESVTLMHVTSAMCKRALIK